MHRQQQAAWRLAASFLRQMVDLVPAGRDPDDLAHEFEPTAQSIRNWIARADGKRADGGCSAWLECR